MRASDDEIHQSNRSLLWEETQAMVSDSQRVIAEARAAVADYRAALERMTHTVTAAREALDTIRSTRVCVVCCVAQP
jgi:hypothetical protein